MRQPGALLIQYRECAVAIASVSQSVEKAFQRRIPRYGSLARGRRRPGHAIERLSSFRECNPPDLGVPRRKLPRRATTFGEISKPARGWFQVWRDRPFCQILSKLDRWRRLRSTKIALSFPPGVQARPRFSVPLPNVQDRVILDAELVTLGRAARERPLIRPIVRCVRRPRPPLATEESGNLHVSRTSRSLASNFGSESWDAMLNPSRSASSAGA